MFDTIKKEVINEYPFLKESNLRIIKKFVMSDGRESSTYLANSNKKGFEKFVVKTFNQYSITKEKSDDLIKEYVVLKMLKGRNIAAPRVLDEQEPKKYLLLSFIEGITAGDYANKGENLSYLFEELGRVVGKIHTIEMEHFGEITTSEVLDWKEFTLGEASKIEIVEELLDKNTFNEAMKQLKNYEFLAEQEANRKPFLLTHDLYLDNFIYNKENKKATYIDYGIALAGRPLFDLAKFYIWTLNEYQYPDQRENFLRGYSRINKLPEDYKEIINMYIIRECFGMLRFFSIMKDKKELNNTINLLKSFLSKRSHT